MSTQMVMDGEDVYRSRDGELVMQREEEYGLNWVLRNKFGEVLDVGAYRNDIADVHNLELVRG